MTSLQPSKDKILLVDDEAAMLRAYERILNEAFDVVTAASVAEAREILSIQGPFAVVVADLRMPQDDGVDLLALVKDQHPDTVRVVLTARSELTSAMDVVHRGNAYRFVTKPCDVGELVETVESCIEHYHLVRTERRALDTAMRDGVRVLTELLTVLNPKALRRVNRVGRIARHVATELGVDEAWRFELAATLRAIGPDFLPTEAMKKVYRPWSMTGGASAVLSAATAYEREMNEGKSHREAMDTIAGQADPPSDAVIAALDQLGPADQQVDAPSAKAA